MTQGNGASRSYRRAGFGPPPDGMAPQVWREAGQAGLYYLGRDANGDYRFTMAPEISETLRKLYPDQFRGLA